MPANQGARDGTPIPKVIELLNKVQSKSRREAYEAVADALGCSFSKVQAIGQGKYRLYGRPEMPGVGNASRKKISKASEESYIRECNHLGPFGGDPIRQMVSTKPWTKEGLNFDLQKTQ